jgi:hypothetical protein
LNLKRRGHRGLKASCPTAAGECQPSGRSRKFARRYRRR